MTDGMLLFLSAMLLWFVGDVTIDLSLRWLRGRR